MTNFITQTSKNLSALFQEILGRVEFTEVAQEVEGYTLTPFEWPTAINDLLNEKFWRVFDPLLKKTIQELKEDKQLDNKKFHDFILKKYFNIDIEKNTPFLLTTFSNAYHSQHSAVIRQPKEGVKFKL